MDWIRARSDEQIEQRIKEIMDATARLYEENRFEDITFAMIAKEADFTRSNLYRYFKTKEDIFLKLLEQDISFWREDVVNTISGNFSSFHDMAESWIKLTLKHKRLIKLFTVLFTIIEVNSSIDALISFKQKSYGEIGTVAQFLYTNFPFQSTESAAEFVTIQYSLIIGFYPMLDFTPKQTEAMKKIGMITTTDYYQEQLIHAIEILLNGYLGKNQE